jgi:PhnB protein
MPFLIYTKWRKNGGTERISYMYSSWFIKKVISMYKVIPFLMVSNGKKAIEIYKRLFGAKLISHMPFNSEMAKNFGFPSDFNYANSTMHATLDIGGVQLYLADNTSNAPGEGNVEIVLDLENQLQIEAIWNKVQVKKYKVIMPLQKTFWGAWYLRFIDEFGVGWQINYNIPAEQKTNVASADKTTKKASLKKKSTGKKTSQTKSKK